MSYPKQAQRRGGQRSRSHGVYALRDRGPEALDADQRQTLHEIQEMLTTSEGIQQALLERVAMGTMIMSVLEDFIKSQVDAGVPLDAITILRSWPSFQNSCVRALMHLRSMQPKQMADSYAEALDRINRVIDEHAEQAPSDAVDAQVEKGDLETGTPAPEQSGDVQENAE